MRKLLNTLYVTTDSIYLSLDGENVVANYEDGERKTIPFHTLEGIVSFSYKGASPFLIGKCVEKNISFSAFSPHGRFLFHVVNENCGNVYLRREQFRIADDASKSLEIAKNFIIGKLYNSKYVLLRCVQDHALSVDSDLIRNSSKNISKYMQDCLTINNEDSLRGIEGNAAADYFSAFNEMILRDKENFNMTGGRTRRPPMDRMNALLSFAYSLLANDCSFALRSVGLDPYVGFMHSDRSGRKSLALDIMEELRSVYADRFAITLVNNRIVSASDFDVQESGAVLLNAEGRTKFISEWQKKKREEIVHPYLKEKIPWGLVPYIQSLLLSKYIRDDLDKYPPFLWK